MKFSVKSKHILFLMTFGCALVASAQNQFVVDPSSLTFTVPTVGANVAPQTVSVSTTSAPVNFQYVSSYLTQGCDRLSVGHSSTVTPATLTVAVNSASLPAGTYSCSLTLTATSGGSAGQFTASIPVTIQVGGGSSGSGGLSVAPSSLSMSVQNGVGTTSANLVLTNSGATAASFSASTNVNWLSVSPNNATVASTLTLLVTANTVGLVSGQYPANITISPGSGAAAIVVPVTLQVSGAPAVRLLQNGAVISSISFAYQSGGQLPAAQSFNLVSSDSTAISCTISQSSGASYLSVLPQGTTTTPQNLTVALTSGVGTLSSGSYSANININCPGSANPTQVIPVNVSVSSLPLLSLGAPPSTFNYTAGGAVPPSQAVLLSSTSNAVPFTTTLSYATGGNWLSVSPSSGTTSLASPAALTLSVNPVGLSSGTYTATVYAYSTGAGNSPVSFVVTLVVGGSTGVLTVSPTALTFNYQIGQSTPPPQMVSVTSGSGSTNYLVTGISQVCPNFLNVSASGGSTPGNFTVSVNPAGLTASQVCSGSITVAATGSPNSTTIPVTMNVSTAPLLQVNPTSLSFSGVLGSAAGSSQTISVLSTDSVSAVGFNVYSAASWITVTPSSGTTPAGVTVAVNPSASGLQAGVNMASISLQSSLSSISVPITYTLTASSNAVVSPTSLAFTQAVGGATPAPQTVSVTLSSGGSAAFSATVISGGAAGWLTVSPTNGSAPGTFTVSVGANGLPAGTYNGSIRVDVAGAGNSPITIPVAFTVTQPATLVITPQSLAFNSTAGGSNPASQTLQITSSAAPINFTASATSTNCNNFITLSTSSGITPANLTVSVNNAGLPAGSCNGTITINGNGSNTQTINVSLTVAAAVPVISSISNAASFSPGSIAPGEIVTIFGSGLGGSTISLGSFSGNRYTTAVNGTQVLFDGIAAPVLYSLAGQVSAVVPFEMAGRLQAGVQVIYNGQVSATLQQRVVDTAPGVFTAAATGNGQGSIVNANGTVNGVGGSFQPAEKGTYVAVYITGAGQTDPNGSTGAAGNSDAANLQRVKAPVSATIGGVATDVYFAGAAPTYIQGLYQVNVLVPQSINSGAQQVLITVGGASTQTGVTINVQ